MAVSCPVCGKQGIADFRTGAVQCPQCESDLSAYHLLGQMRRRGGSATTPLLTGIGGLGIGALLLWALSGSNNEKSPPIAQAPQIARVDDSAAYYRGQVALLSDSLARTAQLTGSRPFTYTVRRGDNLWAIADRFYNRGEIWSTISTANNLPEGGMLREGQSIIIPTPQ